MITDGTEVESVDVVPEVDALGVEVGQATRGRVEGGSV